MNKNDIIAHIASEADLTKAQAAKALDAFLGGVTVTLKKGGDVRIVGFGTLAVSRRKATKGRNPRTGDVIDIPASNQVKFKPGKQLKEAVNK